MEEMRNTNKNFGLKPDGNRPLGRLPVDGIII
jgi:hypothetical protein